MTEAKDQTPEERIAIVFVHGQGQQRPMEDVQELARVVWDANPDLKRAVEPDSTQTTYAKSFTVPDPRLDGADFARVTTESGYYKNRVDFFEFYWADLMVGNRLEHLTTWFMQLQQRPRAEAPAAILPVRQFVIRSAEAVLLLAMLFSFSVALLLPPGPSQWNREQILALTGFPLPPPNDHPWILGVVALATMLTAWIVIMVNDLAGDGMRKAQDKFLRMFSKSRGSDPLGPVKDIQSKTRVGGIWARLGLIFGLVMFGFVIFLMIWQGPTLEWGDLRIPIYLMIILAGLIATFQRQKLATAVSIALAAAALALVCVIFGAIDPGSLLDFKAPPGDFSTSVDPGYVWKMDHGVGNSNFKPVQAPFVMGLGWLSSGGRIMVVTLAAMDLFAAFWFLGSFIKQVSALRDAGWRIVPMVITLSAAIMIAWVGLNGGYVNPPFRWLIFSPGVVLLAVALSVAILAAIAVKAFLIPVMADSARYFSRDPDNVGARQRIRRRGLDLLDQLHKKSPDGRTYKRIIVVAHSLGSVVAYELLNDFWSRQCGAYVLGRAGHAGPPTCEGEKLAGVRDAADRLRSKVEPYVRATSDKLREKKLKELQAETRDSFQPAQWEFSQALGQCQVDTVSKQDPTLRGCNWLITDFITVGSPLTHAALLMADGPADLRKKQNARKLATCPCVLDKEKDLIAGVYPVRSEQENGFTFEGPDGCVRPVHSAVFSAVRWTNLYFKTSPFILEGDPVGGEMNRAFGSGVLDVELTREDTGQVFAHNEYWRSPLKTRELQNAAEADKPHIPAHIRALLDALHLGDLKEWVKTPPPARGPLAAAVTPPPSPHPAST